MDVLDYRKYMCKASLSRYSYDFIFCLCVFVYLRVKPHMYVCPEGPERASAPGAGVTGSCALPDVSARN